jgi:Uma2 family endonuclease
MEGIELVDGFLEPGEVPSRKHGRILSRLAALVDGWLRGRGSSDQLLQGHRVRIGLRRVRKPDLLLVRASDNPVFVNDTLTSPPFLIVEVLTNLHWEERRDRIVKLSDYEALGVPRYWIVDPETDSLDAFALGPDGLYGESRRYGPDEDVPGDELGLPGLTLRVIELSRPLGE